MKTLSRATRRIIVLHLSSQGMNLADIASELGVSRDTARRDLEAARKDEPEVCAPAATPDAPALHLPEDTQLRRDLNVLGAAYRASNEDAARAVLHLAAENVRASWAAPPATARRPA